MHAAEWKQNWSDRDAGMSVDQMGKWTDLRGHFGLKIDLSNGIELGISGCLPDV